MRPAIPFIIFLLSFFFSFAQNSRSWNVYHNNRKLLTGYDNRLKENKYVIDVSPKSLDSAGTLLIECIGMDYTTNGWKSIRTIEISRKRFYPFYSIDSTNRLELDNTDVKKLFRRSKRLDVYTWSHPPKGAGVKVEPVVLHLCTLRLRR